MIFDFIIDAVQDPVSLTIMLMFSWAFHLVWFFSIYAMGEQIKKLRR